MSIADPIVREEMNQGWLRNARRVTVPAGGLLLWSSRLTHQGWSGGPRLGHLVCWEPKERRTETARVRKVALSLLGLPSTHCGRVSVNVTMEILQERTQAGRRCESSRMKCRFYLSHEINHSKLCSQAWHQGPLLSLTKRSRPIISIGVSPTGMK
jgi:hypothetical protein